MADMNDVKNRLKNMLAVNEEKAAVAAEKSDHVVCVCFVWTALMM